MPEENAFWVLETLIVEIMPPAYYGGALEGVHADQRVLTHLLEELYPDLSSALARAGVELHIVTLEWFMCLGCTTLPTHTALRLWDAIFVFGANGACVLGLGGLRAGTACTC